MKKNKHSAGHRQRGHAIRSHETLSVVDLAKLEYQQIIAEAKELEKTKSQVSNRTPNPLPAKS